MPKTPEFSGEFPYWVQEKTYAGRLNFVVLDIVPVLPLSLKGIQESELAVTERELLVLLTKAGTFCTPTEPPKSLVFLENPEMEKPSDELLELEVELELLVVELLVVELLVVELLVVELLGWLVELLGWLVELLVVELLVVELLG
jgi:hypothetical protein